MKLAPDFYLRKDVVEISKDLLGKILFTMIDSKLTAGMISETEAYNGVVDRASHAYGGRRTARTEIMYNHGGCSYVYLCYGIHPLFNVVTNDKDIPHAVLIRNIIPVVGIEIMLKRRKYTIADKTFLTGPGTLTKALGINLSHNGFDLKGNKIWIEDNGMKTSDSAIIATKRIGVESAGKDALLPYRFLLKT